MAGKRSGSGRSSGGQSKKPQEKRKSTSSQSDRDSSMSESGPAVPSSTIEALRVIMPGDIPKSLFFFPQKRGAVDKDIKEEVEEKGVQVPRYDLRPRGSTTWSVDGIVKEKEKGTPRSLKRRPSTGKTKHAALDKAYKEIKEEEIDEEPEEEPRSVITRSQQRQSYKYMCESTESSDNDELYTPKTRSRSVAPAKKRPPRATPNLRRSLTSIKSESDEDGFSLESSAAPQLKPVRRRKGTPRPSLAEIKSETETDGEEEPSSSRSMGSRSVVKRGRATATTAKKGSTTVTSKNGRLTATPKRGSTTVTQKPRRSLVAIESESDDEDESSNSSWMGSRSVVKKRGRATATPSKKGSTTVTPAKRGRGRPPKTPAKNGHLTATPMKGRTPVTPKSSVVKRGRTTTPARTTTKRGQTPATPMSALKRARLPVTPQRGAPPPSLIPFDRSPLPLVRITEGLEILLPPLRRAGSAKRRRHTTPRRSRDQSMESSGEEEDSAAPLPKWGRAPTPMKRSRREEVPLDDVKGEKRAESAAAAAAANEEVASPQTKQMPSDAVAPTSKEGEDAAAPTAADAAATNDDHDESMNEDLAVVSPLKEKEKSGGDEHAATMPLKSVKEEKKVEVQHAEAKQKRSAQCGLRAPKVDPMDQLPAWDPLEHIPCGSNSKTNFVSPSQKAFYEAERKAWQRTTPSETTHRLIETSRITLPRPQQLIVPKEEKAVERKKESQPAGEKKHQRQLQPTVGGAAEAAHEVQTQSRAEGEDAVPAGDRVLKPSAVDARTGQKQIHGDQLQQGQQRPSAAGVAAAHAGTGQKLIPDDRLKQQQGQLQPAVGGAAVAAVQNRPRTEGEDAQPPGRLPQLQQKQPQVAVGRAVLAAPVVRSPVVVANRSEAPLQTPAKQPVVVQYPRPTSRILPQNGRKLPRLIGRIVPGPKVDNSAEKSLRSTLPSSLTSSRPSTAPPARPSRGEAVKAVQPGRDDAEIVLSDEKEKEGEEQPKGRDHDAEGAPIDGPSHFADTPVNPKMIYSQKGEEWLPFPVASTVNIRIAVKKEQLEMDKLVWSQRILVGILPFQAAATVTVSPLDESPVLGVEIFVNEESKAHKWKIEAELTVWIKNCPGNKLAGTFDAQNTHRSIFTDVSLADALKEGSKYQDERGLIPFKISIDLKSVVGYDREFFTILGHPHRDLSDAIIECEGETIYVSSSILANHCRFFEAYYGKDSDKNKKNKKKLVLDDCSMDDFYMILGAMYDSRFPDLTHENVIDALRIAARFRFDQLTSHCIDFFDPVKDNMTSDLLMEALKASDDLKLIKLQKHCVQFMRENDYFNVVKKTEVFQNLSDEYKIHVMEKHFLHIREKKEEKNKEKEKEKEEEEEEEEDEDEDEEEEEEGEEDEEEEEEENEDEDE